MTTPLRALNVVQVDPALFTAPYDAALTRGLEEAGVVVRWITRPPRAAERSELDSLVREPLFYRGAMAESVKQAGSLAKLRKAASHLVGSGRLMQEVRRSRPDIVHLQWAVLPLVDAWIMDRLRRRSPVVFTVHDLTPFNASASSRFQALGFGSVLRKASALIVHTASARDALVGSGLEPHRVVQIPHGPLRLTPARPDTATPWTAARRWRLVLFGKLQRYKGLDVLVEALGRLSPSVLSRLEVIVAGEPQMELARVKSRIAELALDRVVELRLGRVPDGEAHALLQSADAFVFPYLEIEASGVLYLAAGYGRWMIASDLGAFRDVIRPGENGERVPPSNIDALAEAIEASIGRSLAAPISTVTSWTEIGWRTRQLYEELLLRRQQR